MGSSHEQLVGEAYGRVFAVHGSPAALAAVEPELPFSWKPTNRLHERTWRVEPADDQPEGWASATVEGEPLGTAPLTDGLDRIVGSDLDLWVAEHAEGLIFVHAGVVVVDGRAILLPGRTRAGKSTLVAALVREGAEFFSDEFAPIDAQGRVHAYRRAPKQREDSPAAAWPLDLPSADAPLPEPVPVGLVAAVQFHEEAGLDLHDSPAAASVLALMSNTVPARTRPVEALDALTAAVAPAVRIEGTRGDAEAAAKELVARCARF